MKKTIICALAFTSLIACNNVNTSEPVVAIFADNTNVLYIGIDNPVTITASGFSDTEMSASVSEGTVTKDNGKFFVRVTKAGTTTMEIKNGNKKIAEKEFRVKQLPLPIAYIGKYADGESAGQRELAELDNVEVKIENLPSDINFEVLSFDIRALLGTSGGKYVFEIVSSTSAAVTDEMKNLIKYIPAGQKIYIDNILIKNSDGTTRILNGINIMVL